jgi:hypothetical protein
MSWIGQPPVGHTIYIRVGGLGILPAVIRWRHWVTMGCEFVRPLSLHAFEHIVREASKA